MHRRPPSLRDQFYLAGIEFFKSYLHKCPPPRRSIIGSISFLPGQQVPVSEELPVDLTGFVLKKNFHVHVKTAYNDTASPPKPITPDEVIQTLTVGEGVVTLESDSDPAAGFTVTAVAQATGAFQVKVEVGDSSEDPGTQFIAGVFEGVVEAGVFVAGITFVPDSQVPNP